MKNILKNISDLLSEKYSVDISRYDETFLKKSIERRKEAKNFSSVQEYLEFLVWHPEEVNAFMDSLQVSFSEFFRNPLTYSCLEQLILPAMIERKRIENDPEIRIWSAACAEGQEAYSLAILWDEIASNLKTTVSCMIFATDTNEEALKKAGKGVYTTESLRRVTMQRVKNYFTPFGETFIISPKIRDRINFSRFDLLTESCDCPPVSIFGNFDLVLISNLLFYFKPKYRQRIMEKAGYCLVPGGYLVTGETERAILKENKYYEVYPGSAIFEKGRLQVMKEVNIHEMRKKRTG